MRVLLVSHDFLPAHPAGTEIYTYQLGKRLQQRGHDVHVFTTEKDIGRQNLTVHLREYDGLPVHELVNNLFYNEFQETWDYPPAARSFALFLDDLKPDVVHFMHLMYLSVGCLEEVARRNIPVYYTLHDYWLQCPRFGQRVHADRSVCHVIDHGRCGECLADFKFKQSRVQRATAKAIARVHGVTGVDLGPAARKLAARMEPPERAATRAEGLQGFEGHALEEQEQRSAAPLNERGLEVRQRDQALRERILPVVDRFVAPSRFLRQSFIDWGIPEEQIAHMRTGIDLRPFEGFQREPGQKFRIGFIGTVVPHKGLHVLLRAWGRLDPKLRERADLVCYGPTSHSPDYVKVVRDLAQRVGVSLGGALRSEEVPKALARIDLLVVPSVWYENSPLIILEGLATRTPLLVSNLGGMAELVDPGRSGYHFEVGSAESLADQLKRSIEDPEHLGQLYPEAFEVRPVDRDAEELEAWYTEALAARQQG